LESVYLGSRRCCRRRLYGHCRHLTSDTRLSQL
jgi:hypothetical protein